MHEKYIGNTQDVRSKNDPVNQIGLKIVFFLPKIQFFWRICFFLWQHPMQKMSLAEFVFGFRGYSPSTVKNPQKAPSVIE